MGGRGLALASVALAVSAGCLGGLGPPGSAPAAACEHVVPLAGAPPPVSGVSFYLPRDRPHPATLFERDAWGVPLVEATTTAEAYHAIGYALAEDRLWQMEVYRRAGHGTLAEVLGPSYLPVDVLSRTLGYSAAERAGMLAALESDTRDALDAYVEGVNVRVREALADPRALPFEFAALGLRPQPWTVDDVVAFQTVFFVLADFDVGSERANARLWLALDGRFGDGAQAYFDDLVPAGSADAPVTVPAEERAYPPRALPERVPEAQADAVRAGAAAILAAATRRSEATLVRLDVPLPRFGSNMVLVAPGRSASGGPLLYGGPQVGYSVPALFWEADVTVDGARWHVLHVPATGISIGRLGAAAFTPTVGYGDQTDLVVLPLDPDDPTRYLWDGEPRAFLARTERFAVVDRAGTVGALAGLDPLGLARRAADAPPSVVEATVRASHVGPVVAHDPASGFAVAAQRAHRHEDLAVLDFLLDEELPASSLDPAAMRARLDDGLASLGVSFNVFAAFEDGTVSFRQTGRVPDRSGAYDPRLPRPAAADAVATHRWAWSCMPGVDDPARGWLADWNSLPQRSWPNVAAEPWLWGGDHRVRVLDEAVAAAVAAGPVDLDSLAAAVRAAGTRDAFAARVAPLLLDAAGASGPEADAVRAWAAAGAPIVDADGDGNVDHAGVFVYETWRPLVEEAVFGDELGDLGRELSWGEDLLGDNTDSHGSGGDSVLLALLEGRARAPWWDDVRTPAVEGARDALAPTLVALRAELAGQEPLRPTASHVYEKLGAGPDASMPQVNRGSVGLLADLARPGLRTIVTPGQSGHVSAAAGAGLEPHGPHALDQLAPYVAWEFKEYP